GSSCPLTEFGNALGLFALSSQPGSSGRRVSISPPRRGTVFRLNSHVPRKTRAGRPFRALEQLEDRVTPIVGQYAKLDAAGVVIPGEFLAAPLVQPGQGYDGVVKVETAAGMGTGSLFRIEGSQSWGHHILTAAHALNTKAAGTATFEMSRTGAPPAPGAPPPIIRVD